MKHGVLRSGCGWMTAGVATEPLLINWNPPDPITVKRRGKKWAAVHSDHDGITATARTRKEARRLMKEVADALNHNCSGYGDDRLDW